MNLTDRIYLAVHIVLTALVCTRYQQVEHWLQYVVWNLVAIAAIVLLARKKNNGLAWEFTHDWIPVIFFISVFEEVSFLSLSLVGAWQEGYIIRFESLVFAAPPIVLLHASPLRHISELLELGYFGFYPLYPVVAGMLWAWRDRTRYRQGFRRMTDALSIGYLPCYTTYLLFPTQSSRGTGAVRQLTEADRGGPFHFLVGLIQHNAGVHGNAFPSAHIMLAFVVLVFVWRYLPRAVPWLLVLNLLMCVGAIYDGYHYASDTVVGAIIGLFIGIAYAKGIRNPVFDGRE